ncbi:hypothetical protein FRC02_003263 [Tulasnella sp. 418]|nr:hypothetical protein FRC02_003263 [Tulasnella sp. 418]
MCKDASGKWWLFSTAPGIAIRSSTDRINFKYEGLVFPNGAATWTDTYTGTSNGNLWAPDCTIIGGTFWLYYSASSFGVNKSAIFLAKSSTGLPGSWSNQGLVTSTTTSNDYNAIDPHLFIEGSSWYLSLGSFWTGIKLFQLNSSTGKLSSSSYTSIARRTANSGAVEAPIIYKSGSYYYLITSWDKCCAGTSSTYNIRVGRATNVKGPYVDKNNVQLTSGGGTEILATHGSIIGPGGQHVYKDSDAVVINYHYYTSSGSKLGINLVDFSSGWPVVY